MVPDTILCIIFINRAHRSLICYYFMRTLVMIMSQYTRSICLSSYAAIVYIPPKIVCDYHTKVVNGIHIFEGSFLKCARNISSNGSLVDYIILYLTDHIRMPSLCVQHPSLSMSVWNSSVSLYLCFVGSKHNKSETASMEILVQLN